MAGRRFRQCGAEAVGLARRASTCSAHGLRFQGGRGIRGCAPRTQPQHARGICGEISPARPRPGEQPGAEAGRCHGPERLAARAEGPAAAGAVDARDRYPAGTSILPGARRAAAASRALGSMELAIVAGEGGRGTLWIADVEIEDGTPAHAPRATARASLPISSRRRFARIRMEAPAGRPSAVDRDRFDPASRDRRFDRRLARARAGERLPCSRLEQRTALENPVLGERGGRQAQLCISSRAENSNASAGTR